MASPAPADTRFVDYVIARGGTSRGVLLRADDVPRPDRLDAFLIQLFGVGSPTHIDGIGAGTSSASKVMLVSLADGRLLYRFGQVGPVRKEVRWEGHCGNLSVALPIAASALFPDLARTASVATENQQTGQLITFDLVAPAASEDRFDLRPHRYQCRYQHVGPAVCDAVLPADRPSHTYVDPHLGDVDYTVIDATNPCVFVTPSDPGHQKLNGLDDSTLLRVLQQVRRLAAVACGFADDVSRADEQSPLLPRATWFHRLPDDEIAESGLTGARPSVAFATRTLSAGLLHASIPLTSALALATSATLAGTVVHATIGDPPPREVQLQHPLGEITIRIAESSDRGLSDLVFERDARLITLARASAGDLA